MKTLTDETLEQVAWFLKNLAEPNRLKILRCLHDGEKSVSEIMDMTLATQSNVSKHLALLSAARIVASRKDGTSVHYRISDPNITAICDTVCRSIAERIRQERAMLKNIQKGVVG